jgi:hypothetical protein
MNKKRKLREYAELGVSAKLKRRRSALAMLGELKVPLAELQTSLSPEQVMHLPQNRRKDLRSIPDWSTKVPCEKSFTASRIKMAKEFGTETASFWGPNKEVGAYVTDPLKLVRHLIADSPFVAVGGDSGGETLKLGITYSVQLPVRSPYAAHVQKTTEQFTPFVMLVGGDGWDSLAQLRDNSLTKFTGETLAAGLTNIWHVLQYIINTHANAFLNGDWKFISTVLGLQAASSRHPCPICVVDHKHFNTIAARRQPHNNPSAGHDPFLLIDPSRIVPLPLHVFLGIANRIITKIFPSMFGEARVKQAMDGVRQVLSRGMGGLSDFIDIVKQLNGKEVQRWLDNGESLELLLVDEETSDEANDVMYSSDVIAQTRLLDSWMRGLLDGLRMHRTISP